MATDLGTAIQNIMTLDPNITAVTIIDANGAILMQTENWDITNDIPGILNVWSGGGGSLSIQGIKYITLEAIPERLVGTNVQGQGSIVGMAVGTGKIIAYVAPQGEPRSALTAMIEATKGLSL
ncbi:MAG: hypothetical protein ACTSYB_10555 [Candidatus Helarchaeota archaeon]